jgi:acyl-CoA synthetase (NDP forming)
MDQIKEKRRSLDRIFDPASIAIVGASDSFDKVGGRVLASLIHNGFKGAIYPVNPSRTVLRGLPAYPDLEALPQAPDLAILAIPAKQVRGQIEQACRIGAGSVIIFTSGFAELDVEGAREQAVLTELARKHDVRLVGPNCLGIMNGMNGMIASSTVTMRERVLPAGRLAFVSQSGALATFWLMDILNRGLGVSKWVSTGNEADVDLSEVVEYLVEDPDTDVISLYVEGVRDGPRLRAAFARAAELRKPIVILKSGRSAAGAEAAASHTGALAGEDAVYSALFTQYGVCQVDSIREMIDVSRVLLTQKPSAGRRACIISLSGGAGALMTDQACRHGYEVPHISDALEAKLRPIIPSYVQVRNPIDLTDRIIIDIEMYRRSLELVMASGEYDAIFTFMAGRTPTLVAEARAASLELFPRWDGAYANVWQATVPDLPAELNAAGVLVFDEIPEAVRAVARTRDLAEVWANPPSPAIPPLGPNDESTLLSEQASKRLLVRRAALEVPEGILLAAGERAADCVTFAGPYAVKLQSPALPHKSEHGAIEIGIDTTAEVQVIADRMFAMAAATGLPVEGVLVEAMEKIEFEFLVGIRHDPVLGAFLTLGRGGVEVDVDPDVVQAFLPLTPDNIAAMMRRLRCWRLLDGFRGRPPAPIEELARAIARLGDLILENPEFAEVEINPLAVCRSGRVVVIDAAVRVNTAVMAAEAAARPDGQRAMRYEGAA